MVRARSLHIIGIYMQVMIQIYLLKGVSTGLPVSVTAPKVIVHVKVTAVAALIVVAAIVKVEV